MANVKLKDEVLSRVSRADAEALWLIYTHRCLTAEMLREFAYHDGAKLSPSQKILRPNAAEGRTLQYVLGRIKRMTDDGLLKEVKSLKGERAHFLSTLGVAAIKRLYPNREVLLNSSSLSMKEQNISHQLGLSDFGLRFEKRAGRGISYTYTDEKFLGISASMRPDAKIELEDRVFFLEYDTGSESGTALIQKWHKYRAHLASSAFQLAGKKAIMLFILTNERLSRRKQTLYKTINYNLLDLIDKRFEVYAGRPDDLLNVIFGQFPVDEQGEAVSGSAVCRALTRHGLVPAVASFLPDHFSRYEYLCYARKILLERDGVRKIATESGRKQEFLVDLCWREQLSILSKINHYNRDQAVIAGSLGRVIPYVIVIEDVRTFYKTLCAFNCVETKNVFYTTLCRLETYPLHQALFQYDKVGNILSFVDTSYTTQRFVSNVNMKEALKHGEAAICD